MRAYCGTLDFVFLYARKRFKDALLTFLLWPEKKVFVLSKSFLRSCQPLTGYGVSRNIPSHTHESLYSSLTIFAYTYLSTHMHVFSHCLVTSHVLMQVHFMIFIFALLHWSICFHWCVNTAFPCKTKGGNEKKWLTRKREYS